MNSVTAGFEVKGALDVCCSFSPTTAMELGFRSEARERQESLSDPVCLAVLEGGSAEGMPLWGRARDSQTGSSRKRQPDELGLVDGGLPFAFQVFCCYFTHVSCVPALIGHTQEPMN